MAHDLVDECRALQMRRHGGPQNVWIKWKRGKIIKVFISAPILSDRDWRSEHRHADSNKATKVVPVDRFAPARHCQICLQSHGGLSRGLHHLIEHKTQTLKEWPVIRWHETATLYKTAPGRGAAG